MASTKFPAILVAIAGSALAAHAQTFDNGNFENGTTSGWTIAPTTNGQTILQTVELMDMDGAGPLSETFAARFQVGQLVASTGQQAGMRMSQFLNLTAGQAYLVSFNWATNLTPPATTNTEGGVFTLYVNNQRFRSENAGSTTTANQPRNGLLQDVFLPSAGGSHEIAVNITRPFAIFATTNINQWVDNFEITPVTAGACCFSNGSCAILTSDLCTTRGGAYSGDNTTCAAANCPVPPKVVAPFHNTSILGGTANNVLTVNGAGRTLQAVFAASEFAGVPIGTPITGISWRSATATTNATEWPAVDANFADYSIQLSTSNNPPNQLSTTYDANVGPDAVMVRTGPMTIPAGAFPGGAVSPAVNDFGQEITFTTPFIYNGGDLLVTIRHSGSDLTNARTLDSITTSGTGFGIVVQGLSSTNTTNLTGSPAAVAVMQFTLGQGDPCYANCDGSTQPPILNVADFGCFLGKFAAGDPYANCDGSTQEPILNVADFGCFLGKFAAGCP